MWDGAVRVGGPSLADYLQQGRWCEATAAAAAIGDSVIAAAPESMTVRLTAYGLGLQPRRRALRR